MKPAVDQFTAGLGGVFDIAQAVCIRYRQRYLKYYLFLQDINKHKGLRCKLCLTAPEANAGDISAQGTTPLSSDHVRSLYTTWNTLRVTGKGQKRIPYCALSPSWTVTQVSINYTLRVVQTCLAMLFRPPFAVGILIKRP